MVAMKADVIGIDGSVKETIELPQVFSTEHKPKVIHRAVLAMQTAQKQPKGTDPTAGMRNTAKYVGTRDAPTEQRTINVEHARLPRLRNRRALLYGRVSTVPHSVGGRMAHPPKAWENYVEKVNKKERKLALKSAIAASAIKELVDKRFIFEKKLPLVVEDKLEGIAKTKLAIEALEKVGVGKDLENARGKIRRRAGKGRARGRTKKEKKSVLVVTGKNSPILRAVRNLPGVDAVTVNSLNVELLAPGAEAGRLVVWTKSAILELGKDRTQVQKAKIKTFSMKPQVKKEVKVAAAKTTQTKTAQTLGPKGKTSEAKAREAKAKK